MKVIALLTAVATQLITVNAGADIGPQSQYEYTTTQEISQFSWGINISDFLEIEKPALDQGIYRLTSDYTLDDRSYDLEFFKEDCLTAPTGIDSFPIKFYAAENDIVGEVNNVNLKWTYNQTEVEMSDIWTANTTGGNSYFCIRVNNYLPEENGGNDTHYREMDFLEISYKIEVDSLTDFNATIDVIRTNVTEGGVDFINYEEEITVYQCLDTFAPVSPVVALTQGDYLQLCVETVGGSKFGVHSIKELDVSQDSDAQANDNLYPYIDGYVTSPLAYTECTASNTTGAICRAKLQLLSAYFDDYTPSDLFANGTVKLDYVGRRLSIDVPVSIPMTAGDRKLAEEDGASFGVNVELSAEAADSASISVGSLFSTAMAFLAGGSMFTLA